MKEIGRQSFLIVFDFDHTIVDSNTDEAIPAGLGRGDLQRALIAEGKIQWTTLIDTLIAPFSREEIVNSAKANVCIDPDMPSVFNYLQEMQERYNTPLYAKNETCEAEGLKEEYIPQSIEVDIVSASNHLFIEASLQAHLPEVFPLLRQVHSNPYYEIDSTGMERTKDKPWYATCIPSFSINQKDEAERDLVYNAQKTRRSRISWYEPLGNICKGCLEISVQTICKSKAMHRILNTTSLIDPTIIYVGDGLNDNCPVMSILRPRDFVFARRGFPLHKVLSDSFGGCCNVGLWENAKELRRLFQTVMEHSTVRLPTMVRFRDVGDSEFRAVTLKNRMGHHLKRLMSTSKEHLSAAGIKRLEELIESIQSNSIVPGLPGQRVVPAWLRNYAFVTEHDHCSAKPQDRSDWVTLKEELSIGGHCERVLPAPRWGQIPWLIGEILFYHMVWQYVMLKEEPAGLSAKLLTSGNGDTSLDEGKEQSVVANVITPYAMHNPLFSQECKIVQTSGMISPGVNTYQSLNTEFLVRSPLETHDGIFIQAFRRDRIESSREKVPIRKAGWGAELSYTCLLDPLGDSLLCREGPWPTSAGCASGETGSVFEPYRDIFSHEKEELIKSFVKTRIAPILICEPWGAPFDFVGVLLRWMLWGNGLDLSMFSMEELRNSQGESHMKGGKGRIDGSNAGENVETQEQVEKLRDAEALIAKKKDDHIVGNDLERLVHYIESVLRRHHDRESTKSSSSVDNLDAGKTAVATTAAVEELPCTIDIVMDNVGVECISDLCFGLWFIQQTAASGSPAGSVVYHVKSHPYYVSDVTACDFDRLLLLLEGFYNNSEKDAIFSEEERGFFQNALEPFVTRVRAAFTEGHFRIDADTAWTQPCEYRDLPPRLINRYFFTQRVAKTTSTAPGSPNPEVGTPLIPASEIFRMNKAHFAARTSLVIFKGDLNYRRVVGDRHWCRDDFMTSLDLASVGDRCSAVGSDSGPGLHMRPASGAAVEEVVQDTPAVAPSFQDVIAAYWPTHVVPLCCIRTIKSEGCIGVTECVKEDLDRKYGTHRGGEASEGSNSIGRSWSLTGAEGLILFAN
ncbi:unnamed protein product [Phytomonas sp. Hart1]|nr:unnamed protein product [Phytomonas sp. Hart1]|eukprot:CCW71208.1 unnamed protein product [Phytomonas sp. isolate Hart1]